ncbi:SDR family oxidoreductase [Nitrospira defluvii]|uniref:SDR family oxidoreductase n=1 Tax=Nitrospira defluvii TaxID=330214 RepID=UPI001FEA399F|nr:SDR family NAD(P)-dependent oxidoreductase [Nitrospira defluvii]
MPDTYSSSSFPTPQSRTVLVTGASGGIGRRLCLAFARDGFWVGVHYFSHREAAEDTLAELTAAGGQGDLFQADIRCRDDVQAMVDDLQRRRGRLDVLLCNAGIAASHLVVRFPEADWQRIIETNLSGTYRSMTAAAAVMTTGGGSILVIGSYAGLHGTFGQGAYAASKAGLLGLVQTAAREWGPYNIRVNLACPGWQPTGLAGESYPSVEHLQDHVLGRVSNLNDVSMTICRLAQLPDVSGQVWNLDSRIV